jgi:guanylate kinase
MPSGELFILSAPSGAGKTTLIQSLMSGRFSDFGGLAFSVSHTTRQPRQGEVDGRDYHFVGPAGFDELIARGELLEWADIHGGLHRSGTPRAPIEEALEAGRPVLVEVDLQGARAIKAVLPEAVAVFLAPPSFDELARRLRARGTENEAQFARRLATARAELAARDEFDVVVVNDDVPAAVARLVDLLVGPGANPAGAPPIPATGAPE